MQDDFVETLRERALISEVIGEKIPLHRRGKTITALCPFHPDTRPSMQISDEKGIFKCFSCQTGGDVFKFLMEFEKISFPDALKRLAEKYDVPMPTSMQKRKRKTEEDDPHREIKALHALAAKVYHHYLLHHRGGRVARAYLHKRGVARQAIETYMLGYAPPRHVNWLTKLLGTENFAKRFSEKTLSASNLFAARSSENESAVENPAARQDFFHHRLLFPIRNEKQEVLGFGGRALDQHPAKYMNSRDSEHFRKNEILYGFPESYQLIVQFKEVFLVEGYLDVLAMRAVGLPAVAPMGTAITAPQLRKLKRYTRRIHFLFDGDSAGQKATLHGCALAAALEMDGSAYALPLGKDPFDFLMEHRGSLEAVRAQLQSHQLNLYDYLLHGSFTPSQDLSPAQRKESMERLMPVYVAMKDPVIKNTFRAKIMETFATAPEEILKNRRYPSILRVYDTEPAAPMHGRGEHSREASFVQRERPSRHSQGGAGDSTQTYQPGGGGGGLTHGQREQSRLRDMAQESITLARRQREEEFVVHLIRHPQELIARAASLVYSSDFIDPRARHIYDKILHLKNDPNPQSTHILDLFKDPSLNEYIIQKIERPDPEEVTSITRESSSAENWVQAQFNELYSRLKIAQSIYEEVNLHQKNVEQKTVNADEDISPAERQNQEDLLKLDAEKRSFQEFLSEDETYNLSTTGYYS